jgi:trimethylamine-N-oxide reductase (cytochrome c)
MLWTDSPCQITCWNDGNKFVKAVRSPKIEFFLAQHPWMESDCLFADIILPVNTRFEDSDIQNNSLSGQFEIIVHQEQCIGQVGESVSAYTLACMLADRFGVKSKITGDKSVEEWVKKGFDISGTGKYISYEEWKEKGYFMVPTDPDWKKKPVGVKAFYDDPDKSPVDTPTGKIEFYSDTLAEHFPDDKERPPMPKWIEKGLNHDERVSSERAKKYPLLQVSNHPRWREHAGNDDISWQRECPTCKVRGFDGYMYEPLWMNTQDAAKRGIKNGDIVKIHNERGAVLGGAYVSERMMPGAVQMDHGSRYDPIIPGELDRGGAINSITPSKIMSKNATGMVVSSFLVEVEKVTMAQMGEWIDKYPEAFEGPYDPASGLDFKKWVLA